MKKTFLRRMYPITYGALCVRRGLHATGMNEITRRKLNSLRPPMLGIALANMRRRPGALSMHFEQVAYSSGLGEAFVQRRAQRAKVRAKNRVARASRKRNRR